jgi:hypothetical protein
MKTNESVFKKMDTNYEDFRTNPDKFKILKSYYRKKLKHGEELWWMDSEEASANIIKPWSEEKKEKKEKILVDAFILFTELCRPRLHKKYERMAGWQVSRYQLVSPSLRDQFSAGGQVTISGHKFPHVVGELFNIREEAVKRLSQIDRDDLAYYWNVEPLKIPKEKDDIYDMWQTRIMNALATNLDRKPIDGLRKEAQEWVKK